MSISHILKQQNFQHLHLSIMVSLQPNSHQYKAVFAKWCKSGQKQYTTTVGFYSRRMPVMLSLFYLHCYEENGGAAPIAPC